MSIHAVHVSGFILSPHRFVARQDKKWLGRNELLQLLLPSTHELYINKLVTHKRRYKIDDSLM
jgi:hypothetical protein